MGFNAQEGILYMCESNLEEENITSVNKTFSNFPKVGFGENLGVPCEFNGAVCAIYYYVYYYSDPKNDKIVYVGKGTYYRAWSHLNKSSNRKLHNLIKSRQSAGFLMRPVIVDFFATSQEALDFEKKLILEFGREDLGKGTLFNLDDGGAEGSAAGRKVEFRGEIYGSVQALCREYRIHESVFRTRIGLKWSIEQALGLEEKKNLRGSVEINAGGRTWPSITSFAEEIGATPGQVRYYLHDGIVPEKLIDRDFSRRLGTEIYLNGKQFPSIVGFAKFCKKSVKAVNYWLETGWSPDEIFEGSVINKSAIYTTWNGAAVTQTNFAEICGISHTSLIKYRQNNLSNEEIFNLGKRPLSEKLNGKAFTYNGVDYPTLGAFNQSVLKVAMSTASNWTNKFKLTAEQCVRTVELAKRISFSQDISYQGCLAQASQIVREKKNHF